MGFEPLHKAVQCSRHYPGFDNGSGAQSVALYTPTPCRGRSYILSVALALFLSTSACLS